MLAGKTVVLGVSGGIAAYKAAEIVRWLKKEGAAVVVVMTPAARQFISPLTLATLSGNPVLDDLWAPNQILDLGPRPPERVSAVEHIEVADAAHLVLVAPATADLLARVAYGLGDDMVTTVILATRAPVVFAPAMNVQMYDNPIVQENLARLTERGYHIVDPETGELACGWEGRGRLASLEAIQSVVARVLAGGGGGASARGRSADLAAAQATSGSNTLAGRRVVVTAGPTREPLDPVRYLSNHSSGKMGYALARAAREAGAEVTLVSGPTALPRPAGVHVIDIKTAAEMARATREATARADAVLMAAAVADYRPAVVARQKLKRGAAPVTLALQPTADILAGLPRRPGLKVVGFALETTQEMAGARAKLRAKDLDLVVLNNPTRAGSRFGGDTNQVTLVDRAGRTEALPVLPKLEVAQRIVARLAELLAGDRRPRARRAARASVAAKSSKGSPPRRRRRGAL